MEPLFKSCKRCAMTLGPKTALFHIYKPGPGPLCSPCVEADPFLDEQDWRTRTLKRLRQVASRRICSIDIYTSQHIS